MGNVLSDFDAGVRSPQPGLLQAVFFQSGLLVYGL